MCVFASPGNVAFSILGLDVYYYGIIMAVAISVMLFLTDYISRRFYSLNNFVLENAPIILLSGVLGARLYYCILDWQYYLKYPIEILAVRNGGLSIHGALLGGAIALFAICRANKVSFLKICDSFALSIPLAQSIGRWGNFFNSEAFGTPTNLPWKLFIPVESRPVEFVEYNYFHPTFLYESILDFIIFLVMIYIFKSGYYKRNGIPMCVYLILYSLIRIFVEFIRIDSSASIAGIPFPIYVSVVILILSIGILFKQLK